MITVYGIRNCDTCRKALRWLNDERIAHRFHDFRADGLNRAQLAAWVAELGWERLLNRRGTTWRKLAEADRADVTEADAVRLMAANPTLIKRPVLDTGSTRMVGFSQAEREALAAVES